MYHVPYKIWQKWLLFFLKPNFIPPFLLQFTGEQRPWITKPLRFPASSSAPRDSRSLLSLSQFTPPRIILCLRSLVVC